MKTFNRTPENFNWEDFSLDTLKPYLKNELFEAIVGKAEFILLEEAGVIDKENTVLIAIHDPDAANHNPENIKGFKDVLEIKFWDIEESFASYKPITAEQGKEIREFIEANKTSKFLIHCHAGMSRSAGVACAVECIVNFDGVPYYYQTGSSEVKAFNRYHPNFTVFDAIVK